MVMTMLAVSIQAAPDASQTAPFDILFRVVNPKGICQVRPPSKTAFEPAIRNKAYPYGTAVQTVGPESSVVLLVSNLDAVRLLSDTSVAIRKAPDIKNGKLVQLFSGSLITRFSPAVTNTPVVIDTQLGRASDMVGNCKLVLSQTASEASLDIQAESASQVKFIAPQFIIPCLRNGYGANIMTLADHSYSRIRNLLGDYRVFINTGYELDPPLPTEDEGGSDLLLPINTTSLSTINIWRENAPIGNRLIVSVLATDSDGKGSQSFAFAVGDPSVTCRSQVQEIVAATNAPASKENADTSESGEADLLAPFEEATAPEEGDVSESADGDTSAQTDEENSLDEFLL